MVQPLLPAAPGAPLLAAAADDGRRGRARHAARGAARGRVRAAADGGGRVRTAHAAHAVPGPPDAPPRAARVEHGAVARRRGVVHERVCRGRLRLPAAARAAAPERGPHARALPVVHAADARAPPGRGDARAALLLDPLLLLCAAQPRALCVGRRAARAAPLPQAGRRAAAGRNCDAADCAGAGGVHARVAARRV
ncbi:MAG: hypothetical protein J3K34DRAFT_417456 [Monoraphidium minutum]|nr:MAG: hypothetical protein J3K34DRAFT_417456 [Monoraphidium minutum]